MHIIVMNKVEYIQDMDGVIAESAEYLEGFPTVNQFHVRAPLRFNSIDTAHTCQWCNTAYRDSDQRDRNRCPYCWRLI